MDISQESSKACPSFNIKSSLNNGAVNWSPTGKPFENPHGIEIDGIPVRFAGTVWMSHK